MGKMIYLDNASTTKCYPEVFKVMNDVVLYNYGNPSSSHEMGENARKIIDDSRKILSKEINAKAWEIVFTSGATESNNLALFGLIRSKLGEKRKKIIITDIEHSSIYECVMSLNKEGFEIVEIPVSREGLIDIEILKKEIDYNTLLVSVIHGNNEIGVLQNIREIGKICKSRKVLFHTDCVQSFGKENINVKDMNIDMLSASGHKIGGSKGIGFLYVKEGIEIAPLIIGGSQEKGMRAGTENVSGIVGFAKALEITRKKDKENVIKLRDYFISKLEGIGGNINGSKNHRLANNVNVTFNCNAEKLVNYLSIKGIMCSTRSACDEKGKKESRVLKAIGLSNEEINGTIRFSLGFDTSKKEIDYTINEIREYLKMDCIKRL